MIYSPAPYVCEGSSLLQTFFPSNPPSHRTSPWISDPFVKSLYPTWSVMLHVPLKDYFFRFSGSPVPLGFPPVPGEIWPFLFRIAPLIVQYVFALLRAVFAGVCETRNFLVQGGPCFPPALFLSQESLAFWYWFVLPFLLSVRAVVRTPVSVRPGD